MPKPKLHDGHYSLLNFLRERGQNWDTDELSHELTITRQRVNRLGNDLAEHDLIERVRTKRSTAVSMRAKRRER